jgi:hypothetical protein
VAAERATARLTGAPKTKRMYCVSDRTGLTLRAYRALIGGLSAGLLCVTLTACSSVSHVIADTWPHALGGLPEGVPPRPQTPPAYMPIHDSPPPRDTKKLTPEERAKFEAELAASRSQNTSQAEGVKSEAPGQLPPPR